MLIDAGYPELDLPIPWWQGRTLRFAFRTERERRPHPLRRTQSNHINAVPRLTTYSSVGTHPKVGCITMQMLRI